VCPAPRKFEDPSLVIRCLPVPRTDGSPLDEPELTELIRLSRLGDADAFDRLVRHFHRPIYNMAYRLLGDRDNAEDVLQETFIRAWDQLFRLKSPALFFSWIRTIATRACWDRVKGQQRERELVGRLLGSQSGGPLPSHDPDLFLDLHSALLKLPEKLRVIVHLHYYEGRSFPEIARLLNLPVRTARNRHQSALGRLYQAMEGRGVP
jgi:RNA polymerase sigma-70 factor (ECF subfamily)